MYYYRNHYIQKRLLKNFATTAENGKDKICILDLVKPSAEYRNIEKAFYESNLYDVGESEDAKLLEKRFNEAIECPATAVFDRICNSKDEVTITRKEQSLIKKYFLAQQYRTPRNKRNYTDETDSKLRFSKYNIKDGETEVDFWKREMLTILDSEWDDLLKTDMIGVKKHALNVQSSFIMILRTNGEFCINDIGCVIERTLMQIPKEYQEQYLADVKRMGIELYGKDDFDEAEKHAIENDEVYVDNYAMYPISSNCAILLVSGFWKLIYQHPELLLKINLFSPIVMKYPSFPKHEYVNKDKIHNNADVIKYKDDKDTFTYTIRTIDPVDEIHLNMLTLNEGYHFVGVKTPSALIPSIQAYNSTYEYLTSMGMKNHLHHNLAGYVHLLSKL